MPKCHMTPPHQLGQSFSKSLSFCHHSSLPASLSTLQEGSVKPHFRESITNRKLHGKSGQSFFYLGTERIMRQSLDSSNNWILSHNFQFSSITWLHDILHCSSMPTVTAHVFLPAKENLHRKQKWVSKYSAVTTKSLIQKAYTKTMT